MLNKHCKSMTCSKMNDYEYDYLGIRLSNDADNGEIWLNCILKLYRKDPEGSFINCKYDGRL